MVFYLKGVILWRTILNLKLKKVYKGRTNEIFVITDPETQVQYIQTIVIGSDGKGVAITPRLEPDGSIHYKD